MKTLLKYWPLTILAIVIGVLAARRFVSTDQHQQASAFVPEDSTFLPVSRRAYTPPTVKIPGLTNQESSPLPRLPKHVRERDVQRVVRLELKGRNSSVDVVETKDGIVYVAKDSMIERVEVIDYKPPFVAFALFPGVGISLGLKKANVGDLVRNEAYVLPMLKLSMLEIEGIVHVPMIAIDLESIGAGAEVRIYHDFFLGGAYFASYSDVSQRQFKATLTFTL